MPGAAYADFENNAPLLTPRDAPIDFDENTDPIGIEFGEFYSTPRGYRPNSIAQRAWPPRPVRANRCRRRRRRGGAARRARRKAARRERIIAMSRHESRQRLALEYGATDILEARGDEGVPAIKELTDGLGAHSVVEAVGTRSR